MTKGFFRTYRWGDHDRYWGPFTYSPKGENYNPLAFVLTSQGDDDRDNPCSLRIGAFGRSLIIALPPIIRPWRQKVFPAGWDAATVERLGRDWYWDVHPREFGWTCSDGHLSIRYGRQTHDSSTDMTWSCFLPWTQYRQVSHIVYDGTGSGYQLAGEPWDKHQAVIDGLSLVKFLIKDHDGEQITASTYIEERAWRRGEGLFKWMGYIWPVKHRRSLSISFDKEVGPEKGSWKGGTLGTGIEMQSNEAHEGAMRRFCEEDHRSKYRKYKMEFVERLPNAEGLTFRIHD